MYKVYANIRGGSCQTTVGCRERQFLSLSLAISSETLEIGQHYYTQFLVGFSLIPNAWYWMAISRQILFFAPIRLALEIAISEILAWQLIKIDPHCQWQKCSAESLVSGNVRFVRNSLAFLGMKIWFSKWAFWHFRHLNGSPSIADPIRHPPSPNLTELQRHA